MKIVCRYHLTGTMANREDLDDMLHKEAFQQGIHGFLRQNRFSVTPQYILKDFKNAPPA